eukprot:TRINITY_DN69825_c0_g1_i1.p1 TRINITY_DN69825_c0_g1~~TRINITY_DN69825_c0_g1_i1.p1  ORF type:complete len:480 (+),score=118.56 TRINITY_DN69825_c0_g1_i1:60-1499(+)
MVVDYSKFKNIEDSDEEPIWETEDRKKYKGLPEKALSDLEAGCRQLRERRCYCFLDFVVDLRKLQIYEQELQQDGVQLPRSRHLGRVILELDQAEHAPKLCENFRLLCSGERGAGVGNNQLHYKGRSLDFILPKFCIQASIPNEYSCWGRYLEDEKLSIPGVSFDKPGLVAVGNHGPNTNSCTFMITLNEASHLDGYNQIIGRVIRGMEVLRVIEGFPTDRKQKSFAEKNVKTHWGGRPMVDVFIDACGELSEDQVNLSEPADGDIYPRHAIDYSVKSDPKELMEAQDKLREIGNDYFKKKQYKEALEKYKKAQDYLAPLLREQHLKEFADDDASTLLGGGLRPKDRTHPVRAALTVKLNVCQVLMALGEWNAAVKVADDVVLELVGKHSAKGNGALPNDPLMAKALYRRAKARVGLSDVSGEVLQLDEAVEDLRRALQVEPDSAELQRELQKVMLRLKEADSKSKKVYANMLRPQKAS